MSKSTGICFLLCLLILETGAAWGRRAMRTPYRWERMDVLQVLPSQVFEKLGLTHSTRYGFTRDGHTKKTPDPTFPPGLTDVVPYDADHLLLVRGTPQGLTQFRVRVLATEHEITSTGRWRVTVDLLPGTGGGTEIGLPVAQDVVSDIPFQVTVGTPGDFHTYQLRLHVNRDDTLTATCQSSLALPAATAAQTVWTPTQVWTPILTQMVSAGGTVVFDDPASERQSARQRLNLVPEPSAQDFGLRVTVTAPPAPVTSIGVSAASVPPPQEDKPQEDNLAQH